MNMDSSGTLDPLDPNVDAIVQLSILPMTPSADTGIDDILICEKEESTDSGIQNSVVVVTNYSEPLQIQAGGEQQPQPSSSIAVANVVDFRTELKSVMHAFGDESEPSEPAIDMMEHVLRSEIGGYLFLCEHFCNTLTKSKLLGLKEAMLVVKKEHHRLLRLVKYLVSKDQHKKLATINLVTVRPTQETNFVTEIREVIRAIDVKGELMKLLAEEADQDCLKSDRVTHVDRLHTKETYPEYVAHAKARSVSFARKFGGLSSWLQQNFTCETGLSHSFVEVLNFLTYDIIAHMLDLACMVQRERRKHTNPIARLQDMRSANPDTCTTVLPSLAKKRKTDDSNSISEILVQASEIEAKRMKKVSIEGSALQTEGSLIADEIYEAYYRFRTGIHSWSYKVRADRCCQLLHV